MYKSPVDVFEEISTKITEETDNHIVAEIEKAIGVAVDKDELIKALNYDRNQYNQGYNDAKELYASKHESILDKIRAEIEAYQSDAFYSDDVMMNKRTVLGIIDKYRNEVSS